MDKSGNIKAVVIGVGGFLGVGEHLVALPFDKVKFVNEPIVYTGAAAGGNHGYPSGLHHNHGRGQHALRLQRRRSPIRGIRTMP